MSLSRLAHVSIRARDLAASRRFYAEVLGLRDGSRPPFPFPGAWLYLGDDEADFGVVHLIGDDGTDEALSAYLGDRGGGTGGAVDHVAFLADDWPRLRARLTRLGVDFVERTVPALGLRQVFVTDPSGVVVELNYGAGG
ncbi:MAG: glyoxalase [Phenylobacterium sp.]|uniref:VOC family protein n=1 Tax=Phenylobacterium sp. TaxID=1871053 RepID=UPI0025F8D087|nr:VOC family protein [Phenylobacterium sp.]MBI1196558.1 glyoxalase [Phenylobacterium sp.]